MYVQKGGVKLSVLSKSGREAVVAMLGRGDFFGEGCLAGQTLRIGTASATAQSRILVIPKARMTRLLHEQHELSDRFIAHMLSRNARIEQDLVDQLFNSSEKRLARTLLLLARYGRQEKTSHRTCSIARQASTASCSANELSAQAEQNGVSLPRDLDGLSRAST